MDDDERSLGTPEARRRSTASMQVQGPGRITGEEEEHEVDGAAMADGGPSNEPVSQTTGAGATAVAAADPIGAPGTRDALQRQSGHSNVVQMLHRRDSSGDNINGGSSSLSQPLPPASGPGVASRSGSSARNPQQQQPPTADKHGEQQEEEEEEGEEGEPSRATGEPANPIRMPEQILGLVALSGGVHDKSMAQARYLYSTLTSNATALLAATSTASAPPQSPSPTRAHGVQRKQAQFVADRQQRHQSRLKQRSLAEGQMAAEAAAASKLEGDGEHPAEAGAAAAAGATEMDNMEATAGGASLAPKRPDKIAKRPQKDATRLAGGRRSDGRWRRSSGSDSSGPSSGDDEAGGNGDNDDDVDDDDEGEKARRLPGALGRIPVAGSNSDGDDDNEDDNDRDQLEQRSSCPTPSIVESQCEAARRQSQGSQPSSRANSLALERNEQLISSGQQLQLQPTMDPAMHALWAQGADLDTGNGNFIMATRRRRSVHSLNQVQLHQIQQQQQNRIGGLNLAGSGSGGGHESSLAAANKGFRVITTVGQRVPGSVSDTSELSAGGSESAGGHQQARTLKSELRKLRATSSIDEVPQAPSQRTARFAPDSTKPARITSIAPASTKLDRLESATSMEEEIPVEEEEDEEKLAEIGELAETGHHHRRLIRTGSGTIETKGTKHPQQEAPNEQAIVAAGAGAGAGDHVEQRIFYLTDAEYDLEELESSSSMLANLFDWNYNIFELAECYGDSILSKLSYRIFFDSGFFDSFKIPKQAFFNFYHALEEGYHHKPYHNRIHAADVLHAVYYLTSQPIDSFCQVPLDIIEHYDKLLSSTRGLGLNKLGAQFAAIGGQRRQNAKQQQQDHEKLSLEEDEPEAGGMDSEFVSKLHNHIVAIVVAAAAAADDSELQFGIMGANLTALEVMALYTAAAMHDFQHPGRTNSFLVATSSPLALLYNDRSVLENHHSAAAWALFYSGPNFNWLCNLEKDEFKRFRFMIIELILATDLMRHYELVSALNKKLNNVGRHNIDWFCESDRLLVMEIIIKLADVNGPMKGHQLHCQWTDRIAMEFYEQGDEERARNLPVSLYMDRSDPRLPELQKSFINHLVGPLSHSYAAAGFFPRPAIDHQQTIAMNHPEDGLDDDDNNNNISKQGKILNGPGDRHNDGQDQDQEQESVYNQSKYWLIDDSKGSRLNKQFLRCTQTSNLRNNFLYWDAKSKEKQQSHLMDTSTTNESDTTTTTTTTNQDR